MIIDAHVHVKGGDMYYRHFPAEQILRCMDAAGIDLSIVFGICQSAVDNIALTKAEVAKGQGRLIGFAHALPAYDRPVLKDLERAIVADEMRGIKIHAGECRVHDYIVGPVLELAADLDVPCLIDVTSNLGAAKELATRHPSTKLIFPHLGGCVIAESTVDGFIALARDYENVYLDTSYQALAWKIGDAIEGAGANKIIWGSDGPLIEPALELEKVKILHLPQEQEEMVLAGNIARLINLDISQRESK